MIPQFLYNHLPEQYLLCCATHSLATVIHSPEIGRTHKAYCAKLSVAYREPMCRCTLGTPAGISQQAGDIQRNAKLTSQMWQNQGQLLMPREQPSGDITLPALLRTTISEPTVMPLHPGKLLAHCSHSTLYCLIRS